MEVGADCMRYFGVRSYLDKFYDRQGDHEQQGDNQHKYLIPSSRPRFSSRWWKITLWFGTFLVICGFFLLLIGFILPRKKINVDESLSSNSQIMIVDRQALAYNANLETCRLAGICFVVVGGILFTLSLLMPTFCYMWCATGDSNDETDPLKLKMEASSGEQVTPVISSVPKSIQPSCRKNESRITTEGIVPISSS
ncbi:unnamed protein product [Rotaria sordida]|uniref:Neurensin-1 n=1 Tax=Rotaria sordida TaxID=392033 RepID=A0A814KDI5_9BILA|nr:unnamed protein product [Rotaria sordida]CAF1050359.1 unnamed protein product [Rotaria sordida]CAF1133710.1 unnamed protein product [Rotaria sordida]CAF1363403.1 unnamed protein product [Rotaria sordida]CAF1363703.1 unnamed protein product [Rotaria sordida]